MFLMMCSVHMCVRACVCMHVFVFVAVWMCGGVYQCCVSAQPNCWCEYVYQHNNTCAYGSKIEIMHLKRTFCLYVHGGVNEYS